MRQHAVRSGTDDCRMQACIDAIDDPIDGLSSGAASVDALVQRIYTHLHPTVVRAAADSVLAHLIKLRDEGRAVEQNGEWRAVAR